ncbi:extracellular sialidase/neuraminidase [Paramyrothecium foliicola]|nr:extracellular sialidase/neuraminidase [Paramyrothecium foliicola]
MKINMHTNQWLQSLVVVLAGITSVSAQVDDPAKDQAVVHDKYVLFRSANMASPDKLSTGIGFHSFRIPSVVTTASGRLIAFSEGRRLNNADYGDINLVYKRSAAGGNSGTTYNDWGGLEEVWGKGNGTWGNPTAVVDGNTIYLFMSWNDGDYSQSGGDPLPNGSVTKRVDKTWEGRRHLYLTSSTDDGNTWSEPKDLTRELTPDNWDWDAVGPGRGIVLTSGEIVIPARERNIIGRGSPGARTWSYQLLTGGLALVGGEGTITQTPDGRLYRNDRPKGDAANSFYRQVARGTLTSFGAFAATTNLPDPQAEASTLLYNLQSDDGPARVLFLNSASQGDRTSMRIRISYDADAAKFNFGRRLSDTPFSTSVAGTEGGYSSLTKTKDRRVGALVESNWQNNGRESHRCIVWRKFNLSWILNGAN